MTGRDYPDKVPPEVCDLFERMTLDLWLDGWIHYSARGIMHRIRWHQRVEMGNRTFKANNNWTPALARWVMEKHPVIDNFFELRASPGEGGPRHNLEDYDGPYRGATDGD
jgi:hypothetical protein